MAVVEIEVIRVVIGICFLVFMAKVLAGICTKYKIPGIIGEVSAGIIFGPYALGGMIFFFGEPIVQLNDAMLSFAQIGGIVVLFLAGLHFTFGDFLRAGLPSFIIGGFNVAVTFMLGFQVLTMLGYSWVVALLVASALTATSVAVTAKTVEELNTIQNEESRIIVNMSVIDDILGLAVLSIVTSIAFKGEVFPLHVMVLKVAQIFIIWFVILALSSLLIPRIVDRATIWKFRGTAETAAIAVCFGLSFFTAYIGLSPIVGAFAAGVATASSRILIKAKEYIEHLNLIFGTLFFAMIGAQIDLKVFSHLNFVIFLVIFAVAVLSKIASCGVPSILYFRNVDQGLRVGIGMVPRGEVGLIVAGLGLATGIIHQDIYVDLIAVCLATTFLSPFMLRRLFITEAPKSPAEKPLKSLQKIR